MSATFDAGVETDDAVDVGIGIGVAAVVFAAAVFAAAVFAAAVVAAVVVAVNADADANTISVATPQTPKTPTIDHAIVRFTVHPPRLVCKPNRPTRRNIAQQTSASAHSFISLQTFPSPTGRRCPKGG
ncbi:hypothetical protein [Xanthomonas hortorum]|uniref:hypothetical protein n=1 Tax=Xanthomonas hortorum TaxID=56454 RepID=UPI0012DB12BB|nr:hypothetical protein [Xanthomonas hortorum]MCC8497760.1 hypothetical protein [Xanthomonas hortorum pv. gardneri]MCC8505506.1 hypothetical protein [Xanthomonas hortorum pv. gardneri]MCC8511153.1 hypothetical protein [Xanthomonas hortorum pv. gardneri]MCC8518523.1 hypothetical protein [Xanthomonas hortorum pv. gardneri]MCC8523061.1 hypothetical protein [Xanthomonas hortorum pv. gardneri]